MTKIVPNTLVVGKAKVAVRDFRADTIVERLKELLRILNKEEYNEAASNTVFDIINDLRQNKI